MVFPLIIVPILILKLKDYNYGLYIYGLGLVQVFAVFVKFGFDLSGIKSISENRNNIKEKSKIFFGILSIKSVFALISFLFYAVITYYLDATHFLFFLLCFTTILSDIIYPMWYFTAIEKMQFITLMSIFQKFIFLIGILFFVNNEDDYFLLVIFQTISILITGISSIIFIIKSERLIVRLGKISELKVLISESKEIFISNLMNTIVNRFLIFYLGGISYAYVTYFDIADKIRNVLCTPFSVLNQVLYPKISFSKDINSLKKIIVYSFLTSIVLCFVFLLILKELLIYFKPEWLFAYDSIKVASFCVITYSVYSFVGTVLLPLKLNKDYFLINLRNFIAYGIIILIF